ncbi:MAG: hypothetical protein Q7S61_05510 [bacterium]|nr:hypothetical protein [bacterium]
MKKTIFIILLLLSFLPFQQVVAAEGANNKFGIHLAQPHYEDLEKTRDLVNSNGGDWGYVTVVMQENDRKKDKWQDIFERMREYRLIPIIRLATEPEGEFWKRPAKDEAKDWADFLNSLHWVVKERYITIFNEPNHGSEWGGEVGAKDYGETAYQFAKTLKEKNPDFYVMLGGFDASAPSSRPVYEDEERFVREALSVKTPEEWNKVLDGWSSHSYPNPGFAGSPYGSGRGTVRTYEWELGLLKELGIKDLPVFITETGWEGNALSRDRVAENFRTAFQQIWLNDDRVRAVTPFVLNYQGPPFTGFSWAELGNSEYYPQYYMVQDMKKDAGDPVIEEKGSIDQERPHELVINSVYNMKVTLENKGQAIWDKDYGYGLKIDNYDKDKYLFTDLKNIKPNQQIEVDVYLKTTGSKGKQSATIALYKNDKKLLEGKKWNFEIVPLPSIQFHVSLYPKRTAKGDTYQLQIFDKREQLVYKKKGIKIEDEEGMADSIQNVALGERYRVVILRPYYLPRQTFVKITKGVNQIAFERMLPVDANGDGKLDITDVGTFITTPERWGLLLP